MANTGTTGNRQAVRIGQIAAAGEFHSIALFIIPLSMICAVSAASAQSKPDGSETRAQLRERHKTYYDQCMREWDAATHMTKQEWANTCRRVVDNRVKYLLDQNK